MLSTIDQSLQRDKTKNAARDADGDANDAADQRAPTHPQPCADAKFLQHQSTAKWPKTEQPTKQNRRRRPLRRLAVGPAAGPAARVAGGASPRLVRSREIHIESTPKNRVNFYLFLARANDGSKTASVLKDYQELMAAGKYANDAARTELLPKSVRH